MKINEMNNLWLGVNETEDFKVLIVALDKEDAQEIVDGYCLDTCMSGKFVIKDDFVLNENLDCDYVLTSGV